MATTDIPSWDTLQARHEDAVAHFAAVEDAFWSHYTDDPTTGTASTDCSLVGLRDLFPADTRTALWAFGLAAMGALCMVGMLLIDHGVI